MNTEENDGRLSFMEAVRLAMRKKQPAFAAMPVFGEVTEDEEQRAEGARIFIVEPNDEDDWHLRFIAGPFFSNAYAANEILAPDEVPESVRELRFMPTNYEEDWLSEQMQVLIRKLAEGAGAIPEQMPDYENVPVRHASEETVFPVSFIGRDKGPAH